MTVDDLKVGTTFAAVAAGAPTPPRISIVSTGPASARLSWPKSASEAGYSLESTATVQGGWATHPDQGTDEGSERVLNLNDISGARFFQLKKP
jgi:hypothetical protein